MKNAELKGMVLRYVKRYHHNNKQRRDKIMSQTKEEMRQKIMKASNKKILRRQLELLAEYSRTSGTDR